VTDPLARGALLGLTLSHTRAHVWRALLEAVCYGTRACVEGLQEAGHKCHEIVLAGGVTRSKLWLQMHADVTGQTIAVCENSQAPLLGCAILASVGVGIHASVPDAVTAMVRIAQRIHPDPVAAAVYDQIYHGVYRHMASAVRPVAHAIHALRGGGTAAATAATNNGDIFATLHDRAVISPSLLACDWANMQSEVHRCLAAGLSRLHVDIFDGVFLDSPQAFTFGPRMVQAIRQSCHQFCHGDSGPVPWLDLHLCVDRPGRFVQAMAAAAGPHCSFIVQYEALSADLAESIALVTRIAEAGMQCGISVNPNTPMANIYPLLETKLVQVVDLLAVEPGFGGQTFQAPVLAKVRELRQWRDRRGLQFAIMVDGGINLETSASVRQAGADILVAGSFLFAHARGLEYAAQALVQQDAL
jgi:ribulose-phosphate 3-epimerase